MRIFNKFKGTKGFISMWERVLRFRYMITEQAKERCRILSFWEKHGTEATIEAFRTKRRTLFNWQKKLKQGGGKLEALNPQKRTPVHLRKRSWNYCILEELKRLRDKHKNLGKEKLYPLLREYTGKLKLACPSIATIGRLVSDLGGLRDFPQKITGMGKVVKVNRLKILRKPKGFKALYPDHCIALDTIEKQRRGRRMYILVAIDLYSRTCFALGSVSHSSRTMAHFLYLVTILFPYPIVHVLTDNGSEFKKHFRTVMGIKCITHFHTYPKTPKMNAHCERLNRTLQEEFIDYHFNLLFDNLIKFNSLFKDYLLFYNEKRAHCAFKNKLTPIQAMLESDYYITNLPKECQNGWAYTMILLLINIHATIEP